MLPIDSVCCQFIILVVVLVIVVELIEIEKVRRTFDISCIGATASFIRSNDLPKIQFNKGTTLELLRTAQTLST